MTSRGRSSGNGLRGARGRDLFVAREELWFLRLPCCLLGLQFFQLKLKLFQLTLQLLALPAEDHPPVLLDDQFQMFDLLASLLDLLAGQLLLFQQLAVLRDHHRLQCFGIERIEIRQWSRNHDCSMA